MEPKKKCVHVWADRDCSYIKARMGGWIDGWIDKWIGAWIGGCIDGWVHGWVCAWMGGRLDGWANWWVGGWVNGLVNWLEGMDGWIGGGKDGWMGSAFRIIPMPWCIRLHNLRVVRLDECKIFQRGLSWVRTDSCDWRRCVQLYLPMPSFYNPPPKSVTQWGKIRSYFIHEWHRQANDLFLGLG